MIPITIPPPPAPATLQKYIFHDGDEEATAGSTSDGDEEVAPVVIVGVADVRDAIAVVLALIAVQVKVGISAGSRVGNIEFCQVPVMSSAESVTQ